MPIVRPTFSESWYRVSQLKARLRASAQISRQHYRGERWYVVRDPAGNQFHRLSDAAYRFVGLLDGRRTVEQAWDMVGGQLADDAPTQPEVIQILSQLYSANLLEADVTPDATVLLRRHKQLVKRQMQGRLMNLLFPRIPLWDPDRFLQRWSPVLRTVLSAAGTAIWLLVVIAALFLLAPRWKELGAGALDAINPANWFYLWVTFVAIKFIHELGHAAICRRFGGEVHEMGVMFLVFIPTPYVDASSAWAFTSKWNRILVGAAGMIFELFFAALLAFVWIYSNPNWIFPLKQLAYNAMLIASVSTILFNANPLLRYDGYYILSDWLEIPNLRQRAMEYAMGLIKRHVFRLKLPQPLPPVGQRFWLLPYAIASSIYRVFVGIVIIMVVWKQVPVLGVLMSLGGLVTWLVVPVFKLGKYLMLEPELHRKRGRAWAFSGAVAAAVVTLVGFIPFNVTYDAVGMSEAEQRHVLHTRTPGFVHQVFARDGQPVRRGQEILNCRDERLESQILQVEAQIDSLQKHRQMVLVSDRNLAAQDEQQIAALRRQWADLDQRRTDLKVVAPIDGLLIAPRLQHLHGLWLPRGQEVCTVAAMDRLVVRATLQQRDAQLAAMRPDPEAEVRLAGSPLRVLKASEVMLIPAAQDEVPHAALTHAGGEDVAPDPRDAGGKKPLQRQFELRLKLDNDPQAPFYPGQRAYIRCTLWKKPLYWQWSRRLWQLFQAQSMSQ